MVKYSAEIAANRFGYGARPGDLRKIGSNGPDWLSEQITPGKAASLEGPSLPSTQDLFKRFQAYRQDQKERKAAIKEAKEKGDKQQTKTLRKQMQMEVRGPFVAEVQARSAAAITTDKPFAERLTHFWSNHFSVSAQKLPLRFISGAYEREAIRPYVFGSFYDMLMAVMTHPAMLLYLDNTQSIGPNSRAGTKRKRGLNENLAREALELHTVGVNGGYSQEDVTSLAKALTGWSVHGGKNAGTKVGTFSFRPNVHEPGAQTIMGKRYSEAGMDQARTIFRDLSRHPSTAKFISTKLVRHFVSDTPPRQLIDKLSRKFLASDGHLPDVYEEMLASSSAWSDPLAKVKSPTDLVLSTFRAVGTKETDQMRITEMLTLLGQAPFTAPSPAGWPDTAADWIGPNAIEKRLEWANALAGHAPSMINPVRIAERALGDTLSMATKTSISQAADGSQGLTLFVMSPEFQRR